MGQLSWRANDELVERVRSAARESGRSINAYVTLVLDAATNSDLAGDEVSALRERLRRAGLLAPAGEARERPTAEELNAAMARAGRGRPLSEHVSAGR